MADNSSKAQLEALKEEVEKSTFDFSQIYAMLILNWRWFLISFVICVGSALIYLRFLTPVYQSTAKLLIKDEGNRGGSSLQNSTNLGTISTTNGFDNEIEIITSHTLAMEVVTDLKLYTNYYRKGKVKAKLIYKTQPFNVDMDIDKVKKLNVPISIRVERIMKGYRVNVNYRVPLAENESSPSYSIDKTIRALPTTIPTRAGNIYMTKNPLSMEPMKLGEVYNVSITSPKMAAYGYVGSLKASQNSKTTSIARLTISDINVQRSLDYLNQLVICYNRQANEDKNEIALRTEQFINSRLEIINNELGQTEGSLEKFKKSNKMVELNMNANQALSNAGAFEQKLAESETQISLLKSMINWLNSPKNKYQALPTNVGLQDATAISLINRYNEIVLNRNRLLRSASESSPTVTPLTAQLNEFIYSIKRALNQSLNSLTIQKNDISSQFNKYQTKVSEAPTQEKALTQIGRQQEVKSSLYIMLLQKREENSISLAATADKGKLIDMPQFIGKISPNTNNIIMMAILISIGVPAVILFLIQFFHFKIEGHQDVAKLTKLPILADVPIASESAKTRADIVVHENQNNLMEEIFRSMRTNLQFMMKKEDKVIMFTSTTSGEGKTFTAANLAISFALLEKKVIMLGLDIRKPRLAELFEIDDHEHGITNILVRDEAEWDAIEKQILSSQINNNLDLLMAGPTPPNPTELLARESLDAIINTLKEHYDYIIIDTAPVGLVTDTLQISRVCNTTVYMCRAEYTPKSSFNMINSLARTGKLPNVSIVINGIDMSKKTNSYYYGYGNYGQYSNYGRYGNFGNYGNYGDYTNSQYGNLDDDSFKK
ncbi:GumC family protein [Segatella bryantii]|uniref:GumC family protein n=1 Tax=Segatella bryantii TaxID=77095 RepID=UPI00242B7C2A|nr:polysaccharide biosynthesis tyrosine autokinase [Segatella bryantii]